jgi:phage-related protein
MTRPRRVRVGAVTFHGSRLDTTSGFIIEPDGLKGLDDGVTIRRNIIDRPQRPGSFDTEGFPGDRIVTISGFCVTDTPERLNHLRSQLTGLLADGKSRPASFDFDGHSLSGAARLAAQTRFTRFGGDPTAARFQIQLWFPDPYLYGTLHRFGPVENDVALVAHHFGNVAASPKLTVEGSMPGGYTIEGPDGKVYQVTAAATTGHPHTIDMATGLLRVDGDVIHGALGTVSTWTYPSGVIVSQLLNPVTGSGTLTIDVRDTVL